MTLAVKIFHQEERIGHCCLRFSQSMRDADLRIGLYYGELNVDCWKKERWLSEWDSHDVLVMTPQILLDILRHGFVTVGAHAPACLPIGCLQPS